MFYLKTWNGRKTVCKGVVEKEILTIFKLFFEVTFGGNADLPVMTDRLLRNP